MTEWKEGYKKELEKESTEELIEDLKNLKKDLEFMVSDRDSKDTSSLKKSEYDNIDIRTAEENIQIIEGVIASRNTK